VIRRLLAWDLLRFGLVSMAGLGFDLSTAWSLAVFVGIPVPAATLFGFVIGAGVNYVFHEMWTFQSGARRLSTRRWLRYLTGLGITLVTRIVAVSLLQRFLFTRAGQEFATLLAGTGVSFVVNFLLSKYYVFRSENPKHARLQS
jgi:putative flippase GtrA